MSVSAAASVSSAANVMALFKMPNGEYSASSVATDQSDASRLGLIRLKDGNYGSLLFVGTSSAASSAAATSSSGIQAALTNLVLGG